MWVPVYQWTHREFDGVDPWANNQPVRWRVVVYCMIPEESVGAPNIDRLLSEEDLGAPPAAEQLVPAESNDVPTKFPLSATGDTIAVGIFSQVHNRYRVLPLALQDMWRARQV